MSRQVDITITNLLTTPEQEEALIDAVWSAVLEHQQFADIAATAVPYDEARHKTHSATMIGRGNA